MIKVFADTSYFVALTCADDAAHEMAKFYASRLNAILITTRWVLTELGSNFCKAPLRALYEPLIARLEANPNVTILPATVESFSSGRELYAARPDKEWSMVDCISVQAMTAMGISDVLTADHHFRQAGFNALLIRD